MYWPLSDSKNSKSAFDFIVKQTWINFQYKLHIHLNF